MENALALLRTVADDAGSHSLSALAAQVGLPLSTAHRVAVTLERHGFIVRLRRGYYLPGPGLLRLGASADFNRLLAGVGRPIVTRLARRTRCTVHLGVFEDGMVTYLLRSGRRDAGICTRENTQLEAYCTGIGKVLLAALPAAALADYLTAGPFVRMTDQTITDPDALRAALHAAANAGHAVDDAEMYEDLRCLAVPVGDATGRVIAALSISRRRPRGTTAALLEHLDALRDAAAAITARLYAGGG